MKPHIPSNKFFGMVYSTVRLWANDRFTAVSPFCPVRQQLQQKILLAPQEQGAQV